MTKEEKAAVGMVWKGESVESVARKTGYSVFWLKMVTGK
jgi:hypothetical protein